MQKLQTLPATLPIVSSSSVVQTLADQGAPIRFFLPIGVRPGYGNNKGDLGSHTYAFFHASGLVHGLGVARETMRKAWGDTAVKYHADKFETRDGLMYLADGAGSILDRNIDPDRVDMFFELLTTGKTNHEGAPASYTRGVLPV